jgi:hypothetical protein
MGGKAQRCAIVGSNATGQGRTCLDLVQGASQQPTLGQQGINRRHAQRYGGLACPLDAMGTLQPADPFAQVDRNRGSRIVGRGGNKGVWGNDGHRPLEMLVNTRWELIVLCLF